MKDGPIQCRIDFGIVVAGDADNLHGAVVL